MSCKTWVRTAAAVVLAVAGVSACGSKAEPVKGVPVASPTAAAGEKATAQRPAPGDKAPALEQIKYSLETRVLAMGGVAKPTSSTCDTKEVGDKPQTFMCTVKYMGVEVPFRVETKGGFILMQYTATPTKGGVVTREGVHATAWQRYATIGETVRKSLTCDDIPEARLVPVDKPTGYQCHVGKGGLKGDYDVIINGNGGIRLH